MESLYLLKLAKKYDGSNVPISSSPDGSCLFNSTSLALTGTEKYSSQMRIQTLVYLVRNYKILNSIVDDASRCSPNVMEAIFDCREEGGFSGHWTIVALSNVIGRPIDVLYPSIGDLTEYSKILTRVYSPFEISKLEPIRIMWTTLNINPLSGNWNLNHFVPLLERNTVEKMSRSKTGVYATEAFFLSPHAYNNDAENILRFLSPRVNSPKENILSDDISSDKEHSMSDQEASPASSHHEHSMTVTDQEPSTEAFHQVPSPAANHQEPSASDQKEVKNKLPNSQFIPIASCYKMAIEARQVINYIPHGNKSNCFFFLNSLNMVKDNRGFQIYDDCGVYGAHSSHKYYLLKPNLKQVTFKNGVFMSKRYSKFEIMTPQPDINSIVKAYEYSSTLKTQNDFKRKVIRFEDPEHPRLNRSLMVQYKGI